MLRRLRDDLIPEEASNSRGNRERISAVSAATCALAGRHRPLGPLDPAGLKPRDHAAELSPTKFPLGAALPAMCCNTD